MKRWIGTLAFGLLLVISFRFVHAQDGETNDYAARRGAAVYAEFCQACHGPQGEALGTHPAFKAITYQPETTRDLVANGVDSDEQDGVAMPPYAQTEGGLLSNTQIDDLMAYMATWETAGVPPLPEPNIQADITEVPDHFGDAQAGAIIYAQFCNGCHGEQGEGRVPPYFTAFRVPRDTAQSLTMDDPSPYMPPFAAEVGGPLDEQQLQDLDTYLASWELEKPREHASPEGIGTLLVIVGMLTILAVGGAYMSAEKNGK